MPTTNINDLQTYASFIIVRNRVCNNKATNMYKTFIRKPVNSKWIHCILKHIFKYSCIMYAITLFIQLWKSSLFPYRIFGRLVINQKTQRITLCRTQKFTFIKNLPTKYCTAIPISLPSLDETLKRRNFATSYSSLVGVSVLSLQQQQTTCITA